MDSICGQPLELEKEREKEEYVEFVKYYQTFNRYPLLRDMKMKGHLNIMVGNNLSEEIKCSLKVCFDRYVGYPRPFVYQITVIVPTIHKDLINSN